MEKSHLQSLCLRTLGRGTWLNMYPVTLLSVVDIIFEKLVKISLLLTSRNKAFLLIFSVVSGLLIQLQIYSQLHLIKFYRWKLAINISNAFDKVQHTDLLHKLKFYEFSGPFLSYFTISW